MRGKNTLNISLESKLLVLCLLHVGGVCCEFCCMVCFRFPEQRYGIFSYYTSLEMFAPIVKCVKAELLAEFAV